MGRVPLRAKQAALDAIPSIVWHEIETYPSCFGKSTFIVHLSWTRPTGYIYHLILMSRSYFTSSVEYGLISNSSILWFHVSCNMRWPRRSKPEMTSFSKSSASFSRKFQLIFPLLIFPAFYIYDFITNHSSTYSQELKSKKGTKSINKEIKK